MGNEIFNWRVIILADGENDPKNKFCCMFFNNCN